MSRSKSADSSGSFLSDWFGFGKAKSKTTEESYTECEMMDVEEMKKARLSSVDGANSPTDTFETVEYPPKPPKMLDIDSPVKGTGRRSPFTEAEFQRLFDSDGRLVDEHKLRQEIFRGGIEPSIRKEVWRFLFGLYPFHSTAREREILLADHYAKYRAMKARWKKMLHADEEGRKLVHIDYRVEPTDSEENNRVVANGDLPSPVRLDMPSHLEHETQQLTFLDIQAQIAAERLPTDLVILKKAIRVIDKDVPRTDRELEYFRGNDNVHLQHLREILVTFAAFHPDVNYAQGMNDLLSRFLVVLDNEVEAYWCFSAYLEKVQRDFSEDGLLDKLEIVKNLLTEIDPDLWKYIDMLSIGDMSFCHRWMLLAFKREFSWPDSLRLFDILSSHHLELSSMEAEKIRARERRKDFENMEGKSRAAEVELNADFTFDVFLCVTILIKNRDRIFQCLDTADIIQFVCRLTMTIDLESLLTEAELLFAQYCCKAVTDCFLVMDQASPINAPRKGAVLPVL